MLSLVCCVCFTTIADLARFYRAFYGFSELAVTVFGVFGRWFLAQKSAVEELASHTHYGLWGWGSAEISDPPDAANQLNLGNRTWSQPMTSTGGDKPHNNLSPSYGCYQFIRTA